MDDDVDEELPDDEPDDSDVAEDLEEDEPLDDDDEEEGGDEGLGDGALEEEEGAVVTATRPTSGEAAPSDEAEDLGEAEESEAGLDEILRERLRPGAADFGPAQEEEEHEERQVAAPEAEVSPRRAHEFVCRSCFLVKSNNQLADPDRLLCTDCVGAS
jgi:hypothetical protein